MFNDCQHLAPEQCSTAQATDRYWVIAISNTCSVSSSSECTHIGDLMIKCDEGSTFTTTCFYNPNMSDTMISPQAIINESNDLTKWNQSGRKFGQPGQLNFIGPNGTKSITLQQYNLDDTSSVQLHTASLTKALRLKYNSNPNVNDYLLIRLTCIHRQISRTVQRRCLHATRKLCQYLDLKL